MTTANASGTFTGTGWTINVSACNLDTNLSIIDFYPFIAGVPASTSLFQKTSPTVLTYIGTALAANTAVVIQRRTPTNALAIQAFGGRISSASWNAEIDRRVRLSDEYALNGIGPGSAVVAPVPQNDAFGSIWSTDVTYSATREALYNYLITLAALASPALTGVPTAPTAVANTNTAQIANCNFVINQLSGYAPLASPAFTGNPTVLTQSTGDSSTKIANTLYVNTEISYFISSVANTWVLTQTFTLSPIVPTIGTLGNTQGAINEAYQNSRLLLVVPYGTMSQSIPGTSTFTQLTSLPASTLDRAAAYSASAGTYTPPVTGYYRISVTLNGGNGAAANLVNLSFFQGSTNLAYLALSTLASSGFFAATSSTVIKLTAAMAYSFKVYASSVAFSVTNFALQIEFVST